MNDGFLDTNVFLHALQHDDHTEECVRFLERLRSGATKAMLHSLVVHELRYALQRIRRSWGREQIAEHVAQILDWPGIVGETEVLRRAVNRWGETPQISFVDSYLGEVALSEQRPVYTINVRDFEPYGVVTPSPLPSDT